MSSQIILTKQPASSVATPTTDKVTVFVDNDGLYKQKDETGTVKAFHENGATTTDISNAILNHESASDPHPQYLTTVEGSAAFTPISHVGSSGAFQHANATTSIPGFMSDIDKSKLDGIAAGATANATDAQLRDRTTHTGTQLASTISDFTEAAQDSSASMFTSATHDGVSVAYNDAGNSLAITNTDKGSSAVTTHVGLSDPHPQYETSVEAQAKVDAHATLTNNPHSVTKAQVGLGNVDNTSDANKTVSIATQAALDLKYDASNPNGYETPAQLNTRDTNNRNRANHTGTQLKATISDFAHTHPLSEITQSGAVTSQVPTWNGTAWVPQTPAGAETVLRITATQAVASIVPTSLTQLTTASLAIGWYEFRCYAICQSTATTTGLGLRVAPISATIGVVRATWEIDQAVDGTDKRFQYSQLLTTTNLFSTGVVTANADLSAVGTGIFQVTTPGTVAIQLRSETGTSVSARVGSILIIKKVE
jgi:hypothetical protein